MAGFISGVREWGAARETAERPWWGKAETLRTNIMHTTAPWRAPEIVWPHVLVGRAVETCKEFPEQNRSTFLLTSTSDHLSSRYSRVYPFIVIFEARGKKVEISGPLIAENQICCNKIIKKLSPPNFSRIINTPGETLTHGSHPEDPLE